MGTGGGIIGHVGRIGRTAKISVTADVVAMPGKIVGKKIIVLERVVGDVRVAEQSADRRGNNEFRGIGGLQRGSGNPAANRLRRIIPRSGRDEARGGIDRKSTRLNSSHRCISYA